MLILNHFTFLWSIGLLPLFRQENPRDRLQAFCITYASQTFLSSIFHFHPEMFPCWFQPLSCFLLPVLQLDLAPPITQSKLISIIFLIHSSLKLVNCIKQLIFNLIPSTRLSEPTVLDFIYLSILFGLYFQTP